MTVENLRVLYLPKENKDVDLDFPTYIDEWWMEMSVRVSYIRSKSWKVNENGGGNNLHILVCSTFIFTSTEFLDKQNCILMVAYCWEIYGKNVQVRLCDWPSSLSCHPSQSLSAGKIFEIAYNNVKGNVILKLSRFFCYLWIVWVWISLKSHTTIRRHLWPFLNTCDNTHMW